MTAKIAKNTFFLTSAYIGQKIFSFIYFSLIARFVGVENVGLYVTALSFSSLFSIFADLGLTQVLIREGAREKIKIDIWLGQVIFLKIFLAVFAYVFLILITYPLGYSGELRFLIFLSGILMILDSLSLAFYGVLRSLQNLFYESFGVIVGQILTIIAGVIALVLKQPIYFLLVALGAGSFFNFIFSLTIVSRLNIKIKLIWHKDYFKKIVKLTLPFSLAGISTKIYSYIDAVLISILINTKSVGFYSIPNKVVFDFQFIPMAFAASLYPAMSHSFISNKERLKYLFEKAVIYLSLIAFPLAFGVYVLSDVFINKVYGLTYSSSIPALKILVFGLVFAFLDFPVGSLLNACNRQAWQTTAMVLTMCLNIILNLILIPIWEIKGAALAAVASNSFLLFFGYSAVPQIVGMHKKSYWFTILKIFLSSLLMGVTVNYFKIWLINIFTPTGFVKTLIFLGLLITFGGLFYLFLLWITKILSKKEVDEFLSIFRKNYYEESK